MSNLNLAAPAAPQPFDAKPWTAEARRLIALGAPLAATQVAQMAIMTTDVVMIGALGAESLAGAALGSAFFYTVWMLAFGPVAAVAPVIAQMRGRHGEDAPRIRVAARMGLWWAALAALPFLPVFFFAEAMLRALGQEAEPSRLAGAYVLAMWPALAMQLAFASLRTTAAALDRPRPALVIIVAMIGTNAFFNWVLIYGNLGAPALGVAGAGYASSLAVAISVGAMALWLGHGRGFRRYRLFEDLFVFDAVMLRRLIQLGVPIGLTIFFEGALFNVSTLIVGWHGAAALAAHQIAINVAAMTFMVALGLAMAATVRVGIHAGAMNRDGVRRAGWTAIALGSAFMGLAGLVMLIFPQTIAGLYLAPDDPDNAQSFAIVVALLAVAAAFQLVDGAQVLAAHALRGLKDTAMPMWIAGLSYWGVGFPAVLWLGWYAGIGAVGVWIGFALGLGVAAVLLMGRWAWAAQHAERWGSDEEG